MAKTLAVFLAVLLVLTIAAFSFDHLWYEKLSEVAEYLSQPPFVLEVGAKKFSLISILKTLAICGVVILFTWMIMRLVNKNIDNLPSMSKTNKTLFKKIVDIFIGIVAGIIALDVLGIDLSSLAVFGGAIGIGLGFGLQKIASNFVSGFILLMEKSVEEDDLVELADGTKGYVRKTGARFTLLEAFDGREIIIPNEDLIVNRVTNCTYSNTLGRIEVILGVSYEADIRRAQEIILEKAAGHSRCSDDKAPKCFLIQFGASSVDFKLLMWVDDVTQGTLSVQNDVLFDVWDAFKAEGIEIPFPQQDVHIKSMPEAVK